MKIHETGNLNYLISKKSYSNLPKIYPVIFEEIVTKINQQIFDEFGIPENLQTYFELKQERIRVRNEKIQTGDRFLNNEINILNRQIEMLFKDGEPHNYRKSLKQIVRYVGFKLDSRKITVLDYYDYIDDINKNSKPSA